MNTVKAFGNYSIRLEGVELTAYARGGARLARRYYASETVAKNAYKAITSEKKLLAWVLRTKTKTKKNPARTDWLGRPLLGARQLTSRQQYKRCLSKCVDSCKRTTPVKKNPKQGGIEYTIEPLHIDMVRAGDTILRDGILTTVSKSNIKRGGMGKTLFGDSYRLGQRLVPVAVIKHAKPVKKNPESFAENQRRYKRRLADASIEWTIKGLPKGGIAPARSARTTYAKGEAEAHRKAIKMLSEQKDRGKVVYYRTDAPGTKRWVGDTKKNPYASDALHLPSMMIMVKDNKGIVTKTPSLGWVAGFDNAKDRNSFLRNMKKEYPNTLLRVRRNQVVLPAGMLIKKNPGTTQDIPKGKRKGEVFTRGGVRFVVISYTTADGKRVRYARRNR